MTRVDQYRTNPSQAVSNFKGRWDSVFAWPSTAISTWLNGGLFGGAEKWVATANEANSVVTNGDLISYIFTSTGTITIEAGYVDVFILGGGGAGGNGGGRVGGGGGAAGYLLLEDVYMKAGTWQAFVGGSGSDSSIRFGSDINDPLEDDRMDTHSDAKSNKGVSSGFGGNAGTTGAGGTSGGDHAQTDSQKGSGGGGSSGAYVGSSGAGGAGGASGDIGFNGHYGIASGADYSGGAGGGAGGMGTDDSGISSWGTTGFNTRGGPGLSNTMATAGGSAGYYAVGGSAGHYKWGANTDNVKCATSAYENIGGWSCWTSADTESNGDANTGSGGGGGYSAGGSGGSGLIIFQTRAEDA
tara:strand:- start:499 stop:1563 length:1065 start_codon:yes stop_codon:yes gene_type:complete